MYFRDVFRRCRGGEVRIKYSGTRARSQASFMSDFEMAKVLMDEFSLEFPRLINNERSSSPTEKTRVGSS